MYCMRLAENTGHKKSPSWLHRTALSGHIFATKACIDNRKKKQQYLLHLNLSVARFTCITCYMLTIRSVTEELSGKEKLVLQEECELVTVMEVVKGQLEVTTNHMHFFDHTPSRETGDTQDFKWQLAELREIHFRRYNLRRSALEFFFVDQSNCFINFQKEVEKCHCWHSFFETQLSAELLLSVSLGDDTFSHSLLQLLLFYKDVFKKCISWEWKNGWYRQSCLYRCKNSC